MSAIAHSADEHSDSDGGEWETVFSKQVVTSQQGNVHHTLVILPNPATIITQPRNPTATVIVQPFTLAKISKKRKLLPKKVVNDVGTEEERQGQLAGYLNTLQNEVHRTEERLRQGTSAIGAVAGTVMQPTESNASQIDKDRRERERLRAKAYRLRQKQLQKDVEDDVCTEEEQQGLIALRTLQKQVYREQEQLRLETFSQLKNKWAVAGAAKHLAESDVLEILKLRREKTRLRMKAYRLRKKQQLLDSGIQPREAERLRKRAYRRQKRRELCAALSSATAQNGDPDGLRAQEEIRRERYRLYAKAYRLRMRAALGLPEKPPPKQSSLTRHKREKKTLTTDSKRAGLQERRHELEAMPDLPADSVVLQQIRRDRILHEKKLRERLFTDHYDDGYWGRGDTDPKRPRRSNDETENGLEARSSQEPQVADEISQEEKLEWRRKRYRKRFPLGPTTSYDELTASTTDVDTTTNDTDALDAVQPNFDAVEESSSPVEDRRPQTRNAAKRPNTVVKSGSSGRKKRDRGAEDEESDSDLDWVNKQSDEEERQSSESEDSDFADPVKPQEASLAECILCFQLYPGHSALYRHYLNKHSIDKQLTCRYCPATYSLKRGPGRPGKPAQPLCEHIERRHFRQLQADRDAVPQPRAVCLDEQIVTEPPSTQFSKRPNPVGRQGEKAPKEESAECFLCLKLFPRTVDLSSHYRNQHLENGELTCRYCAERFRLKYTGDGNDVPSTLLHRHVKNLHKDQFAADRADLDPHRPLCLEEEVVTNYRCTICLEYFDTLKRLMEHGMRKHCLTRDEMRPPGLFKCGICPRTFDSHRACYGHRKDIHGIELPEGYLFFSNRTCLVCMQKQPPLGLMLHVKEVHEVDGQVSCFFCQKQCRYQSLIEHVGALHTEEDGTLVANPKSKPKHPCDKCGKTFPISRNLRKHQSSGRCGNPRERRPLGLRAPRECRPKKHALSPAKDSVEMTVPQYLRFRQNSATANQTAAGVHHSGTEIVEKIVPCSAVAALLQPIGHTEEERLSMLPDCLTEEIFADGSLIDCQAEEMVSSGILTDHPAVEAVHDGTMRDSVEKAPPLDMSSLVVLPPIQSPLPRAASPLEGAELFGLPGVDLTECFLPEPMGEAAEEPEVDEYGFPKLEEAPAEIYLKVKCSICVKWFSSKATFNKHSRKFHGLVVAEKWRTRSLSQNQVLSCKTCGGSYRKKSALSLHEATHLPFDQRFIYCPICLKLCDRKVGYGMHIRVHLDQSGRVACRFCAKPLPTAGLAQHVETHHADDDQADKTERGLGPDDPTVLHCTMCTDMFIGDRRNLERHMTARHGVSLDVQRYQGRFPCTVCSQTFAFSCALQGHIVAKHPDAEKECYICPERVAAKDYLAHTREHWTGKKELPCRFCERPYHQAQLKTHVSKHRSWSAAFIHCPVCFEKCEKQTNYAHHIDGHSDPAGNVVCRFCEVSVSAGRLDAHIQLDHPADNLRELTERGLAAEYGSLKCAYCATWWTEKEAMRDHVQETHASNIEFAKKRNTDLTKNPYAEVECLVCPERVIAIDYRAHIDAHWAEKKKHPCQICGRAYCRTELRRHAFKHLSWSATFIHCPVCFKQCERNTNFAEHIKLHTDETGNAVCRFCDVSMAADSLVDHIEAVHAEENQRDLTERSLDVDRGSVKCAFCATWCAGTEVMRDHVQTAHTVSTAEVGTKDPTDEEENRRERGEKSMRSYRMSRTLDPDAQRKEEIRKARIKFKLIGYHTRKRAALGLAPKSRKSRPTTMDSEPTETTPPSDTESEVMRKDELRKERNRLAMRLSYIRKRAALGISAKPARKQRYSARREREKRLLTQETKPANDPGTSATPVIEPVHTDSVVVRTCTSVPLEKSAAGHLQRKEQVPECYVCLKLFPSHVDLDCHYRAQHLTPDRRLQCRYCQETFRHRFAKTDHAPPARLLRRHVRKCHLDQFVADIRALGGPRRAVCQDEVGVTKYQCSDCQLYFVNGKALVHHGIKVHGLSRDEARRPGQYACDLCPRTFAQHRTRACHKSEIHGIPIPSWYLFAIIPRSCLVCMKEQPKGEMIKHVQEEHEVDGFVQCHFCQKKCRYQSLPDHIGNFHTEADGRLAADPVTKPTIPCNVCGKVYNVGKSLKVHKRSTKCGKSKPNSAICS